MEKCREHRFLRTEEYYETDTDEETVSENGLIVQMLEVPKKKDEDTLRPKTRSASRKESWNIPKVSMGPDDEISDEDVEMPTKRGRRAARTPSDTA
jgi:hypothetical protein